MKNLLIKFVRYYQSNISSNTAPSCRFSPTCSNYTIEVIEKHGVIIGGLLAIKRIIICNPFGPSGYHPA